MLPKDSSLRSVKVVIVPFVVPDSCLDDSEVNLL